MRGQIKIQQMAFMLIAVTLFLALVGMAVFAFKFSDLKKSAGLLEEKNAMLLVEKLANSPEFSCGKSFGTFKANCVDADKVMMLKKNIGKYAGFWGVANIEIRKLYPEMQNDVQCELDNYPNCNTISLRSTDTPGNYIGTFVSLCRKAPSEEGFHDRCEVAKLMVGYLK